MVALASPPKTAVRMLPRRHISRFKIEFVHVLFLRVAFHLDDLHEGAASASFKFTTETEQGLHLAMFSNVCKQVHYMHVSM